MPDNIKKAKKILTFSTDPGLAIFDELSDINDELEAINKTFGDVKASELAKIKGDDGITPVYGKDYFTEKEVNQIIKEVENRIRIPVDGITPVKGKDYFTKEEIGSIVNDVILKVKLPEDGKDADIETVVDAVLAKIKLPETKDVILDTPEQLRDKLEILTGEDRLDASAIKNLPITKNKDGYVAFSRPLAWYDEGVLLSEYVSKIKLSGAGIQGSLDTDGTLVITVTGGTTAFIDEALTDSGNHTLFTISQTPTSGTLLVINENTGQAVPTSAYVNAGTNITFGSSQEVEGETPVFRARYSY